MRDIGEKDAERMTIHGIILQTNHHKSEELQVGRKGTFETEDMARKNFKL